MLIQKPGAAADLHQVGYRSRVAKKEKSLLYLKKKKQKDFIRLVPAVAADGTRRFKSFLVLFFKKEPLPS